MRTDEHTLEIRTGRRPLIDEPVGMVAAAWAPMLASHGLAALAIAYLASPACPRHWPASRSRWSSGRPPGFSAGPTSPATGSPFWECPAAANSPLLAGALLDQLVGAVVAFAPSGVAWCGFGPAGPVDTPAWTFRGAPIPYLAGDATPPPGFGTSGPVALRPLFERALQDPDAVRAAEIPVERARGPILLVSGEADAMWPSTRLGELVERRAGGRSGPPVTHLRYPGAGHASGGVPGTPAPTEVRHPGRRRPVRARGDAGGQRRRPGRLLAPGARLPGHDRLLGLAPPGGAVPRHGSPRPSCLVAWSGLAEMRPQFQKPAMSATPAAPTASRAPWPVAAVHGERDSEHEAGGWAAEPQEGGGDLGGPAW